MKNILRKPFALVVSLLLILTLACPAAAETSGGDIIILYTNDVHCSIDDYSLLAAYRAQLISEGNTVITVDAGDAVQGEMIGALTEGAAIAEIMNNVGYDLAVPGNHEFDYTVETFLSLAESAEYEYVCANFSYLPAETDIFAPYVIKEIGGKKIAFVGIATPETYSKSTPAYFQDENGNFIYSFLEDEFYETVQNAVDSAVENGAAFVVAVGHLGIGGITEGWRSVDVIANTDGIDAFIDGHAHEVIEAAFYENANGEAVPLSSTGTKFAYFGKMTVTEEGILTELIDPNSLDVESMGEDAQSAYASVKGIIDGYNAEFEYLFEEIGESEVLLTDKYDDGTRAVRRDETNLGNFVTDAYVAVTGADIAFVNGGGVRAEVQTGAVNRKAIMDVNPWNNEMCVLEVTGQQIIDALEYGVHALPDEFGSFPHVSGITFEVHSYIESPVVTDELGDFVSIEDGAPRRVANVRFGENPIDPNSTYTLAGSCYMLQLGGYKMFADAKVVAYEGLPTDTEMLVEYFTEHLGGVISAEQYGDPSGDGRIAIFSEALPLGDVNADNAVDMYDCMMIKSIYFGVYLPTAAELVRADPVADGTVDMYDYMSVKSICFKSL